MAEAQQAGGAAATTTEAAGGSLLDQVLGATKPAERERRRHEPGQRRHGSTLPASRAALATTRIEEVDMTMAAINGETRPAIASGTQMTL